MTEHSEVTGIPSSTRIRSDESRCGARAWIWILALLIGAIGLAGLLAPYLGGELLLRRHGALIQPVPSVAIEGRWFDDYFLVQKIDDTTYAIGEPRYYQGNYSYLLLGTERAVLFDAGTGNRDIAAVVRSLTSLPVTVFPSHLHFDHVGALGHLGRTALLDLRSLRERVQDHRLTLRRYEFLGFADSLPQPSFPVDEWWPPGSSVDLGNRQLQVLWTPGHTPTSGALYDADRHQLFAGDFIYPSTLYVFLPGASRSAYLATARRLLGTIDPATQIYCAHEADDPATISAPLLQVTDLQAVAAVLQRITSGEATASGFYPRVYPVIGPITLATGFSWNNR